MICYIQVPFKAKLTVVSMLLLLFVSYVNCFVCFFLIKIKILTTCLMFIVLNQIFDAHFKHELEC
jgi:hypothetical protein